MLRYSTFGDILVGTFECACSATGLICKCDSVFVSRGVLLSCVTLVEGFE